MENAFVNGPDLPGISREELVNNLNSDPSISIRFNPFKLEISELKDQIPWSRYAQYLEKRPEFIFDPLIHAGAYYVQEAGSQFIEHIINSLGISAKDIKALDLCAAPGGKSTHLSSLITDRSTLVSNEVIRSRCNILVENIIKWGLGNTIVTNNDPKDFSALPGFFDLIVVDAPCSGEGMFRKDPDTINQWDPQNVEHCSLRQNRILNDIWDSLKEDGYLIYSTCTFNESENEDLINEFQKDHQFESIMIEIPKEWGIVANEKNGIYTYRFYPGRTRSEGFVISILKKAEETHSKKIKIKKSQIQNFKNDLSLIEIPTDHTMVNFQDDIYLINIDDKELLEFVNNNLKLEYFGVKLGTVKKKGFIPDHALALSTLKKYFPIANLGKKDAIEFLRKGSIDPKISDKGWILVAYENHPLGWIKEAGGRFNNYYPTNWRIRKEYVG